MNTPPNNEKRKSALITAEQEALLRAFAKAKKLGYGQLSIFFNNSKITGWETRQTGKSDPAKSNVETLQEIGDDIDDDVIAI